MCAKRPSLLLAFSLSLLLAAEIICSASGAAWSSRAADRAGNVYAGGYFTHAGGVATRHLAMWDGSAWSTLGSGVDNQVRTLALDHSASLNVGGDFLAAGGKPSLYVGRWEPVSNLYLPCMAH